MTYSKIKTYLENELTSIRKNGLYKDENVVATPQGPVIQTTDGEKINLCTNNYLGLANSPEIQEATISSLKEYGFGLASVRFICGTQAIHKTLEKEISKFLGTEDTILYSSCFDANIGLFGTLLGPEDAVISDELNHASLIDGIRLCRAHRSVFAHSNMNDLETKLINASTARFRLVVTDGVFSMEGDLARLDKICDLAEKYGALVMVDDSHATGFLGSRGRGTPEEFGVENRIDILTSTMGKALGGASGGFTSGHKEIVSYLRQKSRPYLFSNTLAPPLVAGAIKAIEIIENRPQLRQTLMENARYFRGEMVKLGFDVLPGHHPIVPIMLRDEIKNVAMSKAVNERGVFVVAFSYPVVPHGEARIRAQISAAHTKQHLDQVLAVFEDAGKELEVI